MAAAGSPPSPNVDTVAAAFALISLVTNPAAAQTRLTELNEASKAYRALIDEHDGVLAKAREIAAKEAALAAREQAASTLEAHEDRIASVRASLEEATMASAVESTFIAAADPTRGTC